MTFRIPTLLSSAAFCALFASSALAQDQICGEYGAFGEWIGGDEASSDISSIGAAMDQNAIILLRPEFVTMFQVSSASDLRVEAMSPAGGDPLIEIVDANGDYVTSDDDSGGNGASRVEELFQPGTYCVLTRSFSGGPMNATVRVGRFEHEALTQGSASGEIAMEGACNSDTPAALMGQESLDVLLQNDVSMTASADETPYYRFDLDAPMSLTFTANSDNADPVLTLYDNDGNLLGENDDFDGLNSRLDFTAPLAAGTYCAGLRALSDSTAPITFEISEYDAAEVMMNSINNAEMIPPLDGSHAVNGLGTIATNHSSLVEVGSDAVWHRFNVAEGGIMLIEALAVGNGDPVITVFDELGRQLEYNDDAGGSLDAKVIIRTDPGGYLVAVTQSGGGNGQVETMRLILERFVRAQ